MYLVATRAKTHFPFSYIPFDSITYNLISHLRHQEIHP